MVTIHFFESLLSCVFKTLQKLILKKVKTPLSCFLSCNKNVFIKKVFSIAK